MHNSVFFQHLAALAELMNVGEKTVWNPQAEDLIEIWQNLWVSGLDPVQGLSSVATDSNLALDPNQALGLAMLDCWPTEGQRMDLWKLVQISNVSLHLHS